MDDWGLASNSWSPSTLERAATKNSNKPATASNNARISTSMADAAPASSSHITSELELELGRGESAARKAYQLLPGQQFSLSVCLDSSDGPYRR